MRKNLWWRTIILTGITIIAILFALPSVPGFKKFPYWWKSIFPSKPITLGLDLQGGMHIVLNVQEDRAVQNFVDRVAEDIDSLLKENGIKDFSYKREDVSNITISFKNSKDEQKIIDLINKQYPEFNVESKEPGKIVLNLSEEEIKRIKNSAVSQALETIRNRIDQFGVREPLIQRQGENEILVQLPGVKDPKRAINLIGKTALLEFKLVDENADVKEVLKGKLPKGDEILYGRSKNGRRIPYVVKARPVMTGDVIADARVSISRDFNEPYVSLTFNSVGARLFEKITAENVKKRLAIVLDGTIYSAPVIQEKISGGRAQITGRFTMEEATDLAIVLRAGALPAPVKIIQNLTVGPSLGRDSIEKGIKATIIAGILILVFMTFYYKFSGLIANFAILLNLIMLVGALAALDATLTLPGIAGIILTIGMGVDSNVLIFERIKEELRAGKPVRSAIDSGYDKAFVTIMDSHVTTLITAFILFIFGTGPIKGFAVTLTLGIGINLFTSLVGTKLIYDFISSRRRLETLSI